MNGSSIHYTFSILNEAKSVWILFLNVIANASANPYVKIRWL